MHCDLSSAGNPLRGAETPRHMVLFCTNETERRQHLRVGQRMDYQQLIGTNSGARKLAE